MDPIENSGRSSPPTIESLGIPKSNITQDTPLGKTRTLENLTLWEWCFMLFSVVGLIASIGLTVERLISRNTSDSDFTFGLLLLLTICFCMYYIVHGIFQERSDEILVFVISVTIVLIYCIVNYVQNPTGNTKLGRLVLVAGVGPLLIGFGIAYSVKYFRTDHLIIRTVGGHPDVMARCRWLFYCCSLLIFNLQLQLSMLILVMKRGTDLHLLEKIILPVGIAVIVGWILIGYFAVRLEKKVMVIVFYCLSTFEPGYIIYRFYSAAEECRKQSNDDDTLCTCTIACGILALIVWIALQIVMFIVMNNFGKGLKEKVFTFKCDRSTSDKSLQGSQVE